MTDDKAMAANTRMFVKAARMAEKMALDHIGRNNRESAIGWLTLAKECRWAATGDDGQFSLSKERVP